MSDKPKPYKGSSGEHAAVKEFRAKLESISEHTMPLLQGLSAKLDEHLEAERNRSSLPPDDEPDSQAKTPVVKDPRRDGDSEPPVDVLEEKSK